MREAIIHEGTASRAGAEGRLFRQRRLRYFEGYSVIELLLVVIVSLIMGAIAIVATRSAMASYQLSAAVDSATGAIQGARYQAIMHGYPYQVAFDNTKNTFQVLSEAPPATLFVPTASAVPVSTVPISLSADDASIQAQWHNLSNCGSHDFFHCLSRHDQNVDGFQIWLNHSAVNTSRAAEGTLSAASQSWK